MPTSLEQIQTRLTDVFRDVFDDPEIQIADETTAADIEDWDSLSHIDLIVAVETAFSVRFTTKEVTGLKNVGAFVRLIQRKTP